MSLQKVRALEVAEGNAAELHNLAKHQMRSRRLSRKFVLSLNSDARGSLAPSVCAFKSCNTIRGRECSCGCCKNLSNANGECTVGLGEQIKRFS